MPLHLFLAHADTHAPVLPGGLPPACVEEAPRPPLDPHPPTLADRSGLPDALPDQRWGLVVPRGAAGQRLLSLVEPLRRKRAEDQEAEVVVYEVDPGMGPEDANRWIRRDYWEKVGRRADELPRYLLVLGGPDRVSWDLQHMLGGEAFVGRLAFTDDGGELDAASYEAYVAKVLAWERAAPAAPGARTIFFTARDGTDTIAEGYQHLMKPSLATARAMGRKGKFPASEILEIGGGDRLFSNDDLLDCAQDLLGQAEATRGGLLFSMSHGLGVPSTRRWSSPDEQRRMQGAMTLSRTRDRLTAADVQRRPFMPGGLWLFFACFGAGTPGKSAYAHWLDRLETLGLYDHPARDVLSTLPREGERPFVAALPQKALANPEGPLGVIGQVDLAWTWSFLDDLAGGAGAEPRHERFQGVLRSAVKGHRFGVAHAELAHFSGEVNRALSSLYDARAARSSRTEAEDPRELGRRAELWMQRQDLSAYVLLGDPAARLPIDQIPPGVPTQGSAPDPASIMGFAPRAGA